MSTEPRSILSNDEDQPKRFRSVETALLLALALATVFSWQSLKSIDTWLFGVRVNRSPPHVAPPLTGLNFSASPRAADFLRAGVFDQPLIPVGAASSDDNQELARALTALHASTTDHGIDAVQPIVAFIDAHPDGAWTPILVLNLGTRYRQTGHFSDALQMYQRAWALTKTSTDPNGIRIGDMAVGQLSQFEAYLGRTELLEPLLAEIKDRPLHGTASELVSDSYRGLAEMRNMPQISFRCGPMALARILFYHGARPSTAVVQTLEQSYSTDHGLSLASVQQVSDKVGLHYQMAYRNRGAPVIVPAVVHWKLGHFAALVDHVDDRYLIEDSTFGDNIHMDVATLDQEASGYFLVPAGALPTGWRAVSSSEGESVWGRGNTGSNTDFGDTGIEAIDAFTEEFDAGSCPFNGCTKWNVEAMVVGLSMRDSPVGYAPPIGPAVKVSFQYSQRDSLQPMTFAYTNLGPKWTFNWLSYITDERSTAGIVDLYARGGGDEKFTFSSAAASVSQPGMYSQSTITVITNASGQTIGFTRQFSSGAVEQFSQAMGSQYFLTAVADAQGNSVQLTYDSQLRVVGLTDAIGQVTTFAYGLSADPLKLTQVTDPFGRSATLTYNSAGQLASITDVIGITSSYTYGAGDFISALTTPYGATQFAYGDPGTDSTLAVASERYVTATDTLGRLSRVEFNQAAPGLVGLGCTFPPNLPPQGMSTACAYLPNLLNFRNTYVWDPYQLTFGASAGQPNYNNAKIMHWLHTAPDLGLGDSTSRLLESIVPPGEDRIWYAYQGQQAFTTTAGNVPAPTASGSSNQPIMIGRVVAGTGSGQAKIDQMSYNGTGHVVAYTDSIGRQYAYTYANNGIDLMNVSNISTGTTDLLAAYTYNAHHQPLTYIGANGKTSTFQYNAVGQITQVTDALGNTTTFSYDSNGYMTQLQGAVAGALYSFTYDTEGRLASATDPSGYTVKYSYDAADRLTATTFPDGTSSSLAYHLLDLASTTNRLGQITTLAHDSERELTLVTDALNHVVKLGYCACGAISSITDPNGNTTVFSFDQGDRITQKTYADGSVQAIQYDFGSSLISQVQTSNSATTYTNTYKYSVDGLLANQTSTSNTSAQLTSYTYDPRYPRLTAMNDSTGQTSYSYYPANPQTSGANRLATVTTPIGSAQSNVMDTVTYTYDAINRVVGRSINGGTPESVVYDALGRATSMSNALDTFTYAYVNATYLLATESSAHGPTVALSYFDPAHDDSLQQLKFTGPGGVALSTFNYTYNAEDIVTSFTESYLNQQLAAVMGVGGAPLAKHLANLTLRGASGLPTHSAPGSHAAAASHVARIAAAPILMASLCSFIGMAGFGGRGRWRLAWLATPVVMTMIVVGCGGNGGSSGATPPGSTNPGGPTPPADNGLTYTYAYDAANQLLSATPSAAAAGAFTYTYDAASNVSSIAAANATTPLTSGSTNALTITGAVYDGDGNPTALSGNVYTWDGEDRLTSVATAAQSTTGFGPVSESDFTYDGMSRLVRIVDKQNGSVVADHSYLWCGADRCLEHDNTKTDSPVSKQYFAQGVMSNGTPYYYITDQLGSVRQLVDSSGTVQAQYEYDPYGNRTQVSGTASSDFGFAGYFHHAATGLDFAMYRAYDSGHARWLNRDPSAESGGVNLYGYVSGNPTSSVDPTGLSQYDNAAGAVRFEGTGITTIGHATGSSPGSYATSIAETGYIFANDGTKISAYRNTNWWGSDSNFDYDCHGMTFGYSQVWINDGDVPAILQHDGYVPLQTGSAPRRGDAVIYYGQKNPAGVAPVVHSATLSGVDQQTGKLLVRGKGGITPKPEVTPIESGAFGLGAASYQIYRKLQNF